MLGKAQARVSVESKNLIRSGDSILGIQLEIKSIMMVGGPWRGFPNIDGVAQTTSRLREKQNNHVLNTHNTRSIPLRRPFLTQPATTDNVHRDESTGASIPALQ